MRNLTEWGLHDVLLVRVVLVISFILLGDVQNLEKIAC